MWPESKNSRKLGPKENLRKGVFKKTSYVKDEVFTGNVLWKCTRKWPGRLFGIKSISINHHSCSLTGILVHHMAWFSLSTVACLEDPRSIGMGIRTWKKNSVRLSIDCIMNWSQIIKITPAYVRATTTIKISCCCQGDLVAVTRSEPGCFALLCLFCLDCPVCVWVAPLNTVVTLRIAFVCTACLLKKTATPK